MSDSDSSNGGEYKSFRQITRDSEFFRFGSLLRFQFFAAFGSPLPVLSFFFFFFKSSICNFGTIFVNLGFRVPFLTQNSNLCVLLLVIFGYFFGSISFPFLQQQIFECFAFYSSFPARLISVEKCNSYGSVNLDCIFWCNTCSVAKKALVKLRC